MRVRMLAALTPAAGLRTFMCPFCPRQARLFTWLGLCDHVEGLHRGAVHQQ